MIIDVKSKFGPATLCAQKGFLSFGTEEPESKEIFCLRELPCSGGIREVLNLELVIMRILTVYGIQVPMTNGRASAAWFLSKLIFPN